MALEPNGLADAIEAAFPAAWQDVKQVPFPAAFGDPKERRPLFLAIARALLKYLHDHQAGIIVKMDLNTTGLPGTASVSNVTLNITGV